MFTFVERTARKFEEFLHKGLRFKAGTLAGGGAASLGRPAPVSSAFGSIPGHLQIAVTLPADSPEDHRGELGKTVNADNRCHHTKGCV